MTRTIKYWDLEDVERLTYIDKDEAIMNILDGTDKLPDKIEICGYVRMVPNIELLSANILERLLEDVDDEYGDPDESYTKVTDAMKEAAKEFLTTVLDEYTVWACEIVKRETVDVMPWVKENCPEWLEKEKSHE